MASDAFKRAPLASWISLILEPPLPMLGTSAAVAKPDDSAHTLPMRELGMMNLMVTARDPGTDGTSNGSSLIRRTMRPNAWESEQRRSS